MLANAHCEPHGTLDLNRAYAAHQRALMEAGGADSEAARQHELAKASRIAGCITDFQRTLGADAAVAWSTAIVPEATRL